MLKMSRQNGVVALALLQFAAISLMPLGIRSMSVKVGHIKENLGRKGLRYTPGSLKYVELRKQILKEMS